MRVRARPPGRRSSSLGLAWASRYGAAGNSQPFRENSMAIKVGDRRPEATFRVAGPDGLEILTTKDVFAVKRVVLFAVPGAFTPTCHLKHLPGFVETADDFKKHGVDRVVCVAVNDPFVLAAWEEKSGGGEKVLFCPTAMPSSPRRSAWISTALASASARAPSAIPRWSRTVWSRSSMSRSRRLSPRRARPPESCKASNPQQACGALARTASCLGERARQRARFRHGRDGP